MNTRTSNMPNYLAETVIITHWSMLKYPATVNGRQNTILPTVRELIASRQKITMRERDHTFTAIPNGRWCWKVSIEEKGANNA